MKEISRISLPIAGFVTLLVTIVSGSFIYSTTKTELEMGQAHTLQLLETEIENREKALETEAQERKLSDKESSVEIDYIKKSMGETNNQLTEMRTNIQWIRDYMEDQ